MNRRLYCWLIAFVFLLGLPTLPVFAQSETGKGAIPNFWDPRHRPPKPDPKTLRSIRFLTDEDYPPFHFIGPDGQLTGFNIDLARAICDELKIVCTIQSRRWDNLVDALDQKQGDAIIASLAITPENRKHLEFTDPYYRTPARFVARIDRPLAGVTPKDIAGRTVAVVSGSAHEAYLRAFFPDAVVKSFSDSDGARDALRTGQVEALFGDGVGLAVWLAGSAASNCCAFVGGPFLESRYFGEGVGIAVRQNDDLLRQSLDYALVRLWENGAYATLYLKYFPVGFF